MGRICGALALLLACGMARAEQRPNLIFVFADDQRHDCLGVVQREQGESGRFPWLKTPAMDRLAREGTRFRNAFVVSALCSPSRAAFLTGRYNHANGIINNHSGFPLNAETHASLLRAAGYRTGYFGKWHMQNQPDRPGFDHFASFTGQGLYESARFRIDGKEVVKPGWTDDLATEYAISFLEKERDRPFALVLGFKAPHGPFDPPARLANAYAGESARAVPNLLTRAGFNLDLPANLPKIENGRAPVNLNYFRCITAIDENLGKLLDALDRLKLTDNTVVVYSSDNGFYWGEHGLGDKRSAYEESIRIPLLVRYPGKVPAGAVRKEIALNIDLAPTFLDWAGLLIPKSMQGKSWRSLLETQGNASTPWRTSFLYEYFFEAGPPTAGRSAGGYQTPTLTAARTETAKLIRYEGHPEWTELFDLVADPYETRNVREDPRYAGLLAQLEAEWRKLVDATGYRIPDHVDKPRPAPSPRRSGTVLEYDFAKDQGDTVVDASAGQNHGQAFHAGVVPGRAGGRARHFRGDGWIEVPKSPSLALDGVAFRVEIDCLPEKGAGIVAARGGAAAGWGLFLDEGSAKVVLNHSGKTHTLVGKPVRLGEWTRLTLELRQDGTCTLSQDGKETATTQTPGPFPRDPNDGLQIGMDRGSPVWADMATRGFQGKIGLVRIRMGN